MDLLTFVADNRVIQLEMGRGEQSPGSVDVTVTLDFGSTWRYSEPGWRPISVGVVGTRPYWWSARRLVLLPSDSGEPVAIDVDEDIVLAFATEAGWLLVCETSLRLYIDQKQMSRLELPDVVLEARWKGARLVVLDAGHRSIEVEVIDNLLVSSTTV